MHAYLITGPSQEKRHEEMERLLQTYGVAPLQLLAFTPQPSHGIGTIREIIHFLAIQTTKKGEYRAISIENAHLMTIEAQNAFLKTLEEPPRDTIIILDALREDLLLPTIVSRCSILSTQQGETSTDFTDEGTLFNTLINAGIGEKIKFTEEMGKSREDATLFVERQLVLFHYRLHAQKGTAMVKLGKALLLALEDLSANVNPKIVLFELLLNY